MPKLSLEQKAIQARERMLEKAREYTTGTYIRKFVAPLFQEMIRAEWATVVIDPWRLANGGLIAIVDGEAKVVMRDLGECVCITCGTVKAWDSGIKGMHCGHFLASRVNSILFEEMNVAPQCSACNYYRSGEQQLFRKWMLEVRPEHIERLERLKTTSKQFTRDELVDMRIGYKLRLDAAIERMKS